MTMNKTGHPRKTSKFISRISILIVPFERSLSKLSENHKNFDFQSTEFKLWQLKDSQNHLEGEGVSFNSHNLSTVDPMSKMLGFSESLEKFLSNDVFQSKISSRP